MTCAKVVIQGRKIITENGIYHAIKTWNGLHPGPS